MLGIRIEREIKAKLSKVAREQRRSLSGQALLFIEQGVKHLEELEEAAEIVNSSDRGVKHPGQKGGTK